MQGTKKTKKKKTDVFEKDPNTHNMHIYTDTVIAAETHIKSHTWHGLR